MKINKITFVKAKFIHQLFLVYKQMTFLQFIIKNYYKKNKKYPKNRSCTKNKMMILHLILNVLKKIQIWNKKVKLSRKWKSSQKVGTSKQKVAKSIIKNLTFSLNVQLLGSWLSSIKRNLQIFIMSINLYLKVLSLRFFRSLLKRGG